MLVDARSLDLGLKVEEPEPRKGLRSGSVPKLIMFAILKNCINEDHTFKKKEELLTKV